MPHRRSGARARARARAPALAVPAIALALVPVLVARGVRHPREPVGPPQRNVIIRRPSCREKMLAKLCGPARSAQVHCPAPQDSPTGGGREAEGAKKGGGKTEKRNAKMRRRRTGEAQRQEEGGGRGSGVFEAR